MIQKYSQQVTQNLPGRTNTNIENLKHNNKISNLDNAKIGDSSDSFRDEMITIKLKNNFSNEDIAKMKNDDGSLNKEKIFDKVQELKQDGQFLPNSNRRNIFATSVLSVHPKKMDDMIVPKELIETIGKDLGKEFIDTLETNEDGKITHKTLTEALNVRGGQDFVLLKPRMIDIKIKDEDPAPEFIVSSMQAKFGKEFIENADTNSDGIMTNIEIKEAMDKKLSNGDKQTILDIKDIGKDINSKLDKQAMIAIKADFQNIKDENGKAISPEDISLSNIKFVDIGHKNMVNNASTYGRPDLSKIFLDTVA